MPPCRPLEGYAVRLEALRNRLESGLRETPGIIVFSDDVPRLPNTTLFTVPGLKAETAVIGFDLAGIAVSRVPPAPPAKFSLPCASSHGFSAPRLAEGAVRLSLGWSTSEEEVDCGLEAWRKLAGTLLKGGDETRLERF